VCFTLFYHFSFFSKFVNFSAQILTSCDPFALSPSHLILSSLFHGQNNFSLSCSSSSLRHGRDDRRVPDAGRRHAWATPPEARRHSQGRARMARRLPWTRTRAAMATVEHCTRGRELRPGQGMAGRGRAAQRCQAAAAWAARGPLRQRWPAAGAAPAAQSGAGKRAAGTRRSAQGGRRLRRARGIEARARDGRRRRAVHGVCSSEKKRCPAAAAHLDSCTGADALREERRRPRAWAAHAWGRAARGRRWPPSGSRTPVEMERERE